jgi:hypothetical protein
MWEPEEPEKENPFRLASRYACEHYDQYAASWRTAKEALRDHCRAKYKQYGRWKYIKRSISVLTVIGVWVYTAITACILLESGETNFITRDTEHRSLRAYIGVFNMQTVISPFDKGGFAFITHVVLRNFGQTPAIGVRGRSDWKIDLPTNIPYGSKTGNSTPPAGPMSVAHDAGFDIAAGAHIPDDDLQPIRDLKKVIFFWGDVGYRDVFDRCHKFVFRLKTNYFAPPGQTLLYMGADPNAPKSAIFETDIDCKEADQ